MHIITWINKTDSFGHIYDENDSKFWYNQSFRTPFFWGAVEKLRELRALEGKGNIINLKHVFEE